MTSRNSCKSFVFGKSSKELPILGFEFTKTEKSPSVLILGGVHGDEHEGVIAAYGLIDSLSNTNIHLILKIVIVPMFNIDGVLEKKRTNARGVDLNRNMSTKDWSPEIKTERYHPGPFALSEPENQALAKWLDENKPVFVLSLHSWHPVLNVNGQCLEEAKTLQKYTGYKIDADIGYPTPGCLGTYAGLERNLPTLTYEIERGLSAEKILQIHVPAIIESLKTCADKHNHS